MIISSEFPSGIIVWIIIGIILTYFKSINKKKNEKESQNDYENVLRELQRKYTETKKKSKPSASPKSKIPSLKPKPVLSQEKTYEVYGENLETQSHLPDYATENMETSEVLKSAIEHKQLQKVSSDLNKVTKTISEDLDTVNSALEEHFGEHLHSWQLGDKKINPYLDQFDINKAIIANIILERPYK